MAALSIPRWPLLHHAPRAIKRQCLNRQLNRRGLAAPASGSFEYKTSGNTPGVKFASRDLTGPTTTLALVAKAGTRYEFLPGVTEGLEKFAFKNTEKRSALRIVRETELLGAELSAYHTRESLVLEARFLRDDLPYFIELFGEVATKTKYLGYIYHEEVMSQIEMAQKRHLASTREMALNSAHGLAFHRGLGTPLSPSSSLPLNKYLDAGTIEVFASAVYTVPNFAIVANGADHSEMSKWVGEFLSDIPKSPPEGVPNVETQQSKYYGGEERIAHGSGNTMVIAFPGSSSYTGQFYKPEIAVLATLLGGKSSIKWSPGFSMLAKAAAGYPGAHIDTKSAIYSDAGLLHVTIQGPANEVAGAAREAVKAIKDVASGQMNKEDFRKAVAHAKFTELEFGQTVRAGLELTGTGLIHDGKAYQLDQTAKAIGGVTEDQVKKAAKSLLDSKASVSAVGDLYVLPYAEELGLKI